VEIIGQIVILVQEQCDRDCIILEVVQVVVVTIMPVGKIGQIVVQIIGLMLILVVVQWYEDYM
jgi:hypothetical protein